MNITVDFLVDNEGVAVYRYDCGEQHVIEYLLAIWCGWNTKR